MKADMHKEELSHVSVQAHFRRGHFNPSCLCDVPTIWRISVVYGNQMAAAAAQHCLCLRHTFTKVKLQPEDKNISLVQKDVLQTSPRRKVAGKTHQKDTEIAELCS